MTNIQSKLLKIILLFLLTPIGIIAQTFDFTASNTQGCTPLQVTFTNITDIAYRNDYLYEWTVEPSKFSTEITNVENTYLSPGNYSITMKVFTPEQQLVATISKPNYITAFRDPDVVIASDKQSDCIYKNFQFSVVSEDSDAPITSYMWITSDGASYSGKVPSPHAFSYAGTHTIFVAVEDANGCTNRERQNITVTTVDDFPTPSFISSNPKSVCEDKLTVSFENTTQGTNIQSFRWEFGDGTQSTQNKVSHEYNGYGTYYAVLRVLANNGCESTSMVAVRLEDFQPDIVINDGIKAITGTNKACPGTVNFSMINNGTSTLPVSKYEWDYQNNGSVDSENATYSVSNPTGGFAQIKLTATTLACTKIVTKNYAIEDPLIISYSPTQEFACKLPATIPYDANSNVPGTTYEWGIDGVRYSGKTVSHTYNTQGFFPDTLFAISPNQCTAQLIKPNNVEIAIPQVTISPISSPIEGCAPLTVDFDKTVVYNTLRDSVKTVEWDLDNDGIFELTGEGPKTHTYEKRGVYPTRVKITTYEECEYTDTTKEIFEIVRVGHKGKGDLVFPDTIICASDELQFLYINSIDSLINTPFYDNINVMFTHIDNSTYYSQTSTSPFNFQIQANFRDTIGIYSVSFELDDHGCKKQFTDVDSNRCEIIYGPFGIALDTICPPTQIHIKGPIIELQGTPKDCDDNYKYSYYLRKFINVDTTKSGEFVEWFIQEINSEGLPITPKKLIAYNKDSIHINYDHDTLGRGIYRISVYAYNQNEECVNAQKCNCIDSVFVSHRVTDIKTSFRLLDTTVCVGDTAVFYIKPDAKDVETADWLYTYDSVFQHQCYPPISEDTLFYVFNNRNIHEVIVIGKDVFGCTDTARIPIKVYQPKAYFFADIVSDCLPFETQFTDSTIHDTTIVARKWDFGNGFIQTGNDSITTTEYSQAGLTSPKLTVTDILGCVDSITRDKYIRPVVPNSIFTIQHPKVCLNHEATFIRNTNDPNYDNNIHKYSWDFGDNTTYEGSLLDTTRHTYTEVTGATPYTVNLTAYSMSPEGNECKSSTSKTIDIKDFNPTIDIVGIDKCKEPGQKFLVFVDRTKYSKYSTVAWYKEDGDVRKLISTNKYSFQVATFDNYGDQKLILYTTSDYYGCQLDSVLMDVEVPGYEAEFIADKYDVCVREDVNFTLTKQLNIDKYVSYWEFGDGNSDYVNIANTTHSYTTLPEVLDNKFKVQFIVNAPNCKPRDIYKHVTIYPVLAEFDRGLLDADSMGCAPLTVKFYNNSAGLTSNNFIWNFGDGTTSTEKDPTHTFATIDSVYNVNLSITNNVCPDNNTKQISTHPLSNVTITTDTTLCYGEQTTISATGDFTSIRWSPESQVNMPNSATTLYNPYISGYIYAHLATNYGCESTDSVYVYVQQFPRYQGAPDSLLLFYKTPTVLEPVKQPDSRIIAGQLYNVNNTPVQGVAYSWSPSTYLSCDNCISPDIDLQCGTATRPSCIDFPEFIDYTVHMVDSLGCFEADTTIRFHIIIETKAALPQAFTPNNDGENDMAFVRGWGIKEFLEVKIYNRWGQLVYESNDLYQGWDGTFKGEPQAMDTYAYTIRIINTDNKEEFIKGYITLLR